MHREFNRTDEPEDPAFEAVNEAGGGESEGFEMAEEQLIEHASHGDWGGTARITEDAEAFEESEQAVADADVYAEGDEAVDPDSLEIEPDEL